jgi:chromosome segregation ATPase
LAAQLSNKDIEMATLNGSVRDLSTYAEQCDAAMAAMQEQLEQVAATWRAKLEASRCEAEASTTEMSAKLKESQAAVARERAACARLRQERDEAASTCSKAEREAGLTQRLKQQHWEAVKQAEVLRAEVIARCTLLSSSLAGGEINLAFCFLLQLTAPLRPCVPLCPCCWLVLLPPTISMSDCCSSLGGHG